MATEVGDGEGPTFFMMSTASYFPGTVAMLNSLRLTGNRGKVVILDLDLSPDQRRLLEQHAAVIGLDLPRVGRLEQLKPYPHFIKPRGVIVVGDSDMIVTRSLDHVLALARRGKICVYPDADQGRWFAEWEEIFGLASPPRHLPYCSAGFVAFSTDHWPRLLERWWKACELIPPSWSRKTAFPDQDALNALLMSEIPPGSIAFLPREEVAYRQHRGDLQVKIVDPRTLSCTREDRAVTLLHYGMRPKPWEDRGWVRLRRDAYVGLMPRLLFADDVPIPLAPSDVPMWLRPGLAAGLARAAIDRAVGVASRMPGPVRAGIWRRIAG